MQSLRSFLDRNDKDPHIELAAMIDAVASADPSSFRVLTKLYDLLRGCPRRELRDEKYKQIAGYRNPPSHDARQAVTGVSIKNARSCIELCVEYFSLLESPPPSPPRPAQPGRR